MLRWKIAKFSQRFSSLSRSLSTFSAGGNGEYPSTVKLGAFLTKYGTNLTKLAWECKLDPVVGRDDEITRTIQVLSRRKKNNPCLIGEPGVGKTAIAEGLARRIASGDVPASMKDCVIMSLDLASMLAGAKFRGEFEERLKGVLKDIEQVGNRVILFIDEIHVLVGAGAAEGAIDASNILKPPLARGLLRCMGATTIEEYRKYIEKDAALARRFQTILVSEPNLEATVEILKGIRSKYEIHHGVRITDDAIVTAAKLSDRYIPDRRRPDKAIDLIDEAASRLRILQESKPPSVVDLEGSISELRYRLNFLKVAGEEGEIHEANQGDEYRAVKYEIDDLSARREEILSKWQETSKLLGSINEKRTLSDSLSVDIERLRKSDQFDKMRRLEDHEKDVSKSIHELYNKLDNLCEDGSLSYSVLNSAEVSEIVARSTGIPVGKLLDEERAGLLNMEVELGKQVIGQQHAISAISKCIRLSRAGLRYHDRPLGVFLMLGPTGVGKTELAKSLSRLLFNDSQAMVRIDMSEYMERFSVSRLVGAPPGYVGYEEGGVLTEAVRRRPYQVILLDEFEKAHREVSNLLLQVFDEGRLSDSHGRVADFKNTVIIMTSNLGQRERHALQQINKNAAAAATATATATIAANIDSAESKEEISVASPVLDEKTVMNDLIARHFAPEFLNRIDEVITFNALDEVAIESICNQQLHRVKELLKQHNITLQISAAATKWIADTGYDKEYGARPLKRLIQSQLLNPLATLILEKKILSDDVLLVVASDDSQEITEEFEHLPMDITAENPLRLWVRRE